MYHVTKYDGGLIPPADVRIVFCFLYLSRVSLVSRGVLGYRRDKVKMRNVREISTVKRIVRALPRIF